MSEQRLPLPPFTLETAIEKVRKAEDAWNTRDPQRVALAYTIETVSGAIARSFFKGARRSSCSSRGNGPRSSTIA